MKKDWRKIAKWTGGILAGIFIAAFVGLSIMAGGPRDVYGLVRYALPHMHRGTLRPGDQAPDASLISLDGSSRFRIRDRIGARPLVVVFGSFT